MFPMIYDTKILSYTSKYFGKTDLAMIFQKCTRDYKMTGLVEVSIEKNRSFFKNQVKCNLSNLHIAAIDAYQTGFSFLHILKYMDPEEVVKIDAKKFNPFEAA